MQEWIILPEPGILLEQVIEFPVGPEYAIHQVKVNFPHPLYHPHRILELFIQLPNSSLFVIEIP